MLRTPAQILLDDISSFLKKSGMAPTQFGIEALGDPNFLRHLRAGRDPRLSTAQRVRDFMASQDEGAV